MTPDCRAFLYALAGILAGSVAIAVVVGWVR